MVPSLSKRTLCGSHFPLYIRRLFAKLCKTALSAKAAPTFTSAALPLFSGANSVQRLFSKRPLIIAAAVFLGGFALLSFLLFGPPRLLALSESPDFCASCHVMEEQHTAWRHDGAHRGIRCVDCHLPNDNAARHYAWKAIDGMKDVIVFHSGRIPDPITLSSHGRKVVQENCNACHEETVSVMDTSRSCWQCHQQTRHKLTGLIADREQLSHQGDEQ